MEREWPLRWDLLQRYRLIEIIALWEGRLTTRHLCDTFGIGRQQASRDINEYIRSIGPGNLDYDRQLRGYRPAPGFEPVVTTGAADEYLHLLNRDRDLRMRFDSLPLEPASNEVLHVPHRRVRPKILRPIVTAAKQQRRIEVEYISLHNPVCEVRVIAPHTLVFTGVRWHVRAYCEKNRQYRDFVLSRFRGEPDIMDETPNPAADDAHWHTMTQVIIKADPRLNAAQRSIIEEDYGMVDGALVIDTRGPLVQYVMQLMQIDPTVLQGKPSAQQIVVDNLEDIRPWLF